MKKRLLSFLLATIFCLAVFASCSSSSDNAESTESQSNEVIETDPEILKVNEYVAALAEENQFDGMTFSYVGGAQQPEFEEETGNIENDALYKRQREIEDIFSIEWINAEAVEDANSTTGHAVVDSVKRSVMAGTKAYDLVAGNLSVVGQPLFNGHCLEDTSNFSVLNLSAEWWPATLSDTHSLAGKLYFLTGPIINSYYMDSACVLYNKAVAENFSIEAPYDLVNDGDWTFDKMIEVASAVPYNTDGSGVYRYGKPNGFGILYGFGYRVTQFDDEGVPYVDSSLPQRLSDIADRVSAVMGDDSQSAHNKFETHKETALDKFGMEYEDLFADNRILFLFGDTGTAMGLREKDVEFGILPVPKENKAQESYYSFADIWSARFCYVPICTSDIAMTDVITEAMAALSLKHIKPAYYDKLLKGRSTHDTDSREMIDIISKNKVYDIIGIYSLGDINQAGPFVRAIEKAVVYDTTTLSSDYLIYSKMANKQITSIMSRIEKK